MLLYGYHAEQLVLKMFSVVLAVLTSGEGNFNVELLLFHITP